jgi:hypothetical protein
MQTPLSCVSGTLATGHTSLLRSHSVSRGTISSRSVHNHSRLLVWALPSLGALSHCHSSPL